MANLSFVEQILVWAIPTIFAITLHEVAHGWMASRLGDKTALALGRLTINPIKHIDPLGTLLVPAVLLLLNSNFVFGWAKPVPVNPAFFRNPKRDTALVAAAGPVANLLMAMLWAVVAKLGLFTQEINAAGGMALVLMGHAGIFVNLILLVLNLIPIPPLDGSRVLSSFLPTRLAIAFNKIEPFGFLIVVGLLFLNILSTIIHPIVLALLNFIVQLFKI